MHHKITIYIFLHPTLSFFPQENDFLAILSDDLISFITEFVFEAFSFNLV